MEFKIISDSTSDLPHQIVEELNLTILPLKFYIDDVEYYNYSDHRMISPKDFYAKMKSGATPSTAQINPDEFIEVMKPILDKGEDVLILLFSSALSGTYNSARIAQELMSLEYPDRKIIINDTKAASLGEGLLVYLASLEKQKGKSIEEVNQFVNQTKMQVAHWFTVDDINHLRRGGRITSVASLVAKTLNIKPVMHVDGEGRLIPRQKVMGRKKSIKTLFEQMKKTALPNQEVVFIGHADCLEEAMDLSHMIEEHFNIIPTVVGDIGPVIGSHAGHGTLGLFFLAENR